MKTIKILGTGCPKCKQTEAVVKEVITQYGLDAEVVKVDDIQQIIQYNVLTTPAVVVDEIVQIKGRVPSSTEIKTLLNA